MYEDPNSYGLSLIHILAGWFEDIQLAYSEATPSQLYAQAYLERAARRFGGGLYLGGHSKGGALALLSLIHISPPMNPTAMIQIRSCPARRPNLPAYSAVAAAATPSSSPSSDSRRWAI